ncbi:putative kynureninase [Dendryphion nanum]|uniref:Kynureninase n=1 Tax=Dendryphion nanum TaxID=256645 RepID=A0A9P9DGI5_9PLEO|nr:putative kynureninase [Dendryphion nanum]
MSRFHAQKKDYDDPLRRLRSEFHIPKRSDMDTCIEIDMIQRSHESVIYLAGSAIGLQPKLITTRTTAFLNQWARRGIAAGHTAEPENNCPSWLEAEQVAADSMAPIVGALNSEVTLMGTLTANLHFLLASFYLPKKAEQGRTRILIEEGAFASDRYAIQSQIEWHGLDPTSELISIPCNEDGLLSTAAVCDTIELFAHNAALLILSGVQFHTGQLLEIPHITRYARERGIVVGWDLAHAVGNVELKLHEWDVDFAVWCSYKYLNAGPGATAGIFVHDRHGKDKNRRRLAGWWGVPIPQRFEMTQSFAPNVGAAGFKVSSPSILDITAVTAALQLLNGPGMAKITEKSRNLTGYLESLLDDIAIQITGNPRVREEHVPWTVITPRDPAQRGAMLSLRWREGDRMEQVARHLRDRGVIVDIRKPDIMRITPAPLYNTFEDVWMFAQKLEKATIAIGNRDSTS